MEKDVLTLTQTADIIFQKPDRITTGIRDNASFIDRLNDMYFKLTYKFVKEVEVEEHPRSFKKAALELHALGFSRTQITSLREEARRVFTGLEHSHDGKIILDNALGGDVSCDDAFLGTAGIEGEKIMNTYANEISEPLLYERLIKRLSALHKKKPETFIPN